MVLELDPEKNVGLGGNGGAGDNASASSSSGDSSGGTSDSYQTDRGRKDDIMTASVNAEASLLQGGYNPAIANAVSASRGIGVSEESVEKAASEYARMAQDAVREGRPPESIRFDDPNLSQAARAAIYAEAAQQNGTTTQEVERRAEEQNQQAMQQLQQGIVGGALATGAGLIAALDNMTGQTKQPEPAQQQAQAANPFGISQGVLQMLRGSVVDYGNGTAGFADAMDNAQGYSKTVAAAPGFEKAQGAGQSV